jgi:ABC-2 type transport system permease protein
MKALSVIKREYMENVRKKSFLISTILVPVLLMAFTFVPMLSTLFVPNEQLRISVLDDFFSTLKDTLKDGRKKYVVLKFDDMPATYEGAKDFLISKLENGELDIALFVPDDVFESREIYYYTKDVGSVLILEKFENRLNSIVLKKRLAQAGLDYENRRVTKAGKVAKKNIMGEWGLVFGFVMILYMTLLTWGMSIQRSLIEEKSSRVIEVLLSSLEPKDLFFGKIVGLGAVGLTQITIWTVTGLSLGFYMYLAASSYFEYLNISPLVLVYFIVFFILGFLFYSAIFAMVGAICSTEQEAQQLQGLLTMPLILPLLVLMLIIQSPNSTVSVVLSMIPVFAPMIMLARIVILMPDFWQIAVSVVLLIISIYGAVYFSSRVFRVGILMYGKRPGLREIIKWFKYA